MENHTQLESGVYVPQQYAPKGLLGRIGGAVRGVGQYILGGAEEPGPSPHPEEQKPTIALASPDGLTRVILDGATDFSGLSIPYGIDVRTGDRIPNVAAGEDMHTPRWLSYGRVAAAGLALVGGGASLISTSGCASAPASHDDGAQHSSGGMAAMLDEQHTAPAPAAEPEPSAPVADSGIAVPLSYRLGIARPSENGNSADHWGAMATNYVLVDRVGGLPLATLFVQNGTPEDYRRRQEEIQRILRDGSGWDMYFNGFLGHSRDVHGWDVTTIGVDIARTATTRLLDYLVGEWENSWAGHWYEAVPAFFRSITEPLDNALRTTGENAVGGNVATDLSIEHIIRKLANPNDPTIYTERMMYTAEGVGLIFRVVETNVGLAYIVIDATSGGNGSNASSGTRGGRAGGPDTAPRASGN